MISALLCWTSALRTFRKGTVTKHAIYAELCTEIRTLYHGRLSRVCRKGLLNTQRSAIQENFAQPI